MRPLTRLSRRTALAQALAGLVAATGLPVVRAGAFEDFFIALAGDDASKLLSLALRGFDLNTRDEKGTPPLLVAIREEAWKSVDFLLRQRNIDLDARNAHDENALMLAALKGQVPLVRRLIERGAEVNKPGWTPLHYAASHPGPASAGMIDLLLEHHAYIDAESPNGTTPLMMAARYGDPKGLGLLLEAGADPTLRNALGLTALDFAQQAKRPDNVDRLVRALRAASGPTNSW
jgi:uncharacterized protein